MSNQDIIYIEDDDSAFESLQLALRESGLTNITQVTHGSAALSLARESRRNITWIVDGKFPMDEVGRAEEIGPQIVEQIRAMRGINETMIGFSTDPAIFKSDMPSELNHNLDKGRLWQSIPEMTEILLKLSRERTTPAI